MWTHSLLCKTKMINNTLLTGCSNWHTLGIQASILFDDEVRWFFHRLLTHLSTLRCSFFSMFNSTSMCQHPSPSLGTTMSQVLNEWHIQCWMPDEPAPSWIHQRHGILIYYLEWLSQQSTQWPLTPFYWVQRITIHSSFSLSLFKSIL